MPDTERSPLYTEEDALDYIFESIAPVLKSLGVGCRSISIGGLIFDTGNRRAQIQATLSIELDEKPGTTGTA
jgi:hypothetical protein